MGYRDRPPLNILDKSKSIRTVHVQHPSKTYLYHVFKCLVCPKEIKVRTSQIRYSTGKCKKHAQMHRPYEAVFGAILRSARERGIDATLTYEQYLTFVGSRCFYCARNIPWDPYNTHGKNSPGYYLDRTDPEGGYTIDNVVPCCTVCNMAKRGMKKDDFIGMCANISNNHASCGS